MAQTESLVVKGLLFFSKASGWFALATGAVALVDSSTNVTGVLSILLISGPMEYLTALGFVLGGAGLVFLRSRWPGTAVWFGGRCRPSFVADITGISW